MLKNLNGLWQNPDFMKLWYGQTISMFGSRMALDALILTAVLLLSATPGQIGLLGAVQAVPALLVGLFAGVWIDRHRRRPVLIFTDFARAITLLSIPVAAWFNSLQIEQLYIVAAIVGVLTIFFQIADQSFLPSVVDREQLVEANSKFGTTGSLAEIGGPPLGGLLIQLVSAPLVIFLDALSFLASAFFISLVRKPEVKTQAEQTQNIWQEIGEGLTLIWQNPILRAITLTSATQNFFGSFFGTLYTLYALRELGLTPAFIGLAIGTGGIGALLGAVVAGRLNRRFGIGPMLGWAALLGGLLQSPIAFAADPPLVALLCLIVAQIMGDIWLMVFAINETSVRQSVTPELLLGRANASNHFLSGIVRPFGLIIAGILAEAIGLRPTVLIAVMGLTLASLWVIFSPVGKLKEF